MISSIHTLNDSLIAIGVLVGVVVAFVSALMGAGALAERQNVRSARPGTLRTDSQLVPQHVTQSDDRQLVLR